MRFGGDGMIKEWRASRQEYASETHEGFVEWLLIRKISARWKILLGVVLGFLFLWIGIDFYRVVYFFKFALILAVVVGIREIATF